jgi:putative ABC transport system permease protein
MENQTWTVVGIVDDVEPDKPQPVLYVPYLQSRDLDMDIAIRTAIAPMRLAPDVRSAIRALDPRQPVTNLNTMEELIHQEAFGLVYIAALMGIFGALALGLSFVGVYGLMNCLVSEQVREIGVRMALGASHQNIIAMFCFDGLRKAAVGLLIGFFLALGLERIMRATLLGVTGAPLLLLCLPLVLAAAVAIAVYIPARKATRVDPVDALRC